MAKLSLRHIYKVYPNGVKAVNDFNMEIEDKEFIVFVGPSGCGKSTTLRMIAGLEEITAGELIIGDELVNDMEPKDRDIAMVFQNYALYPHMTVYDNMAFGLRLRHMPPDEIHRRVLWAADVLKLTEYLNRKPRAMSGGQRQRVSLGRAILRNPKVFLLDEPLSNLDAKLRTEMRAEIAKLHSELGTTFIYVTHDQVEAMTLGTRVVVMKLGFIQQIDTPQNLYDSPENKFVAGFIGTPQMNFFEGTLHRHGDKVHIKFDYCDNELTIPFNQLLKVKPSYLHGDVHVTVGLRCEDIAVVSNDNAERFRIAGDNQVKVKVSHFEELGNETLIYGDLNMSGDGYVESSTRVIIKSYHGALNLNPGDIIDAVIDMNKAHFFDLETEDTICPRVPTENVFDVDVKNGVASFLGFDVPLPPAIKCPDVERAELLIPTEAISIGEGKITAKVEYIEEVKGVRLAYLNIKGRTFFAFAPEGLEVGKDVKIDMDFKQISITSHDRVPLVEKLSVYDKFVGGFTNLENRKRSVKSLEKYGQEKFKEHEKAITDALHHELAELGHKKYRLQELKVAHTKKLQELKDERVEKLATCTGLKEDKKAINDEYNVLIADEKAKYKETVAAINAENDPGIDEAVANAEAAANEKIAAERQHFELHAAACAAGEEASRQENVDLVKERLEILKGEVADINGAYEAKVAEIKEAETAEVEDTKASTAFEDEKMRQAEIDRIHREYADKLKAEKAHRDREIDDATTRSKVFYVSVDGHYILAPTAYVLKVVQALGVGLFESNFRYEIPHDAYHIVPEGIEGIVEEVLDYGKEKFAKCLVVDDLIYVKLDREVKVGDHINLTFDLENVRIYENKFDIRLI